MMAKHNNVLSHTPKCVCVWLVVFQCAKCVLLRVLPKWLGIVTVTGLNLSLHDDVSINVDVKFTLHVLHAFYSKCESGLSMFWQSRRKERTELCKYCVARWIYVVETSSINMKAPNSVYPSCCIVLFCSFYAKKLFLTVVFALFSTLSQPTSIPSNPISTSLRRHRTHHTGSLSISF